MPKMETKPTPCVRHILVAVKNPGATSLPAVTKSVQLARALGADLELFHALDSPVYVDMMGITAGRSQQQECDERQQYLQRLERVAARARLHGVNASVAAEWDYPGYEAIIRRAHVLGADLIVAERQSGRHIAASVLSPADWELLRLSPIPVLLVTRARPYHRPRVLTALDPGRAFAKPAELDEQILRLGTLLANGLRGQLHAVHASRPRGVGVAEVQRLLDEQLADSGVARLQCHVGTGNPWQVIRDVACQVGASIVVVGSISRSGLKRLWHGNTAEQLLDCVPCDLLVVKPANFAMRVDAVCRGPHVEAPPPLG